MPPSRTTPVALWLGCALLCAPVSSLRAPAVPRARGPSAIYQPAPGHPNLGQIALNLEPFDLSMPEFGALAMPRPETHALVASETCVNATNATPRIFELVARRKRMLAAGAGAGFNKASKAGNTALMLASSFG